jgi:hypothetical protein
MSDDWQVDLELVRLWKESVVTYRNLKILSSVYLGKMRKTMKKHESV